MERARQHRGEGGNSAFGGGPSGSFSGGDPDAFG
jgi:hypothetical protein